MWSFSKKLGVCLGLVVVVGLVGATASATSVKPGKSYGCVFPVPKNNGQIIKYIQKSLNDAKAPADLDIGILFRENLADLSLKNKGEVYHVKWKLNKDCKGGLVLQTKLEKGAAGWLRAINSQEFIKGVPVEVSVPKAVKK